MGAPDRTTGLPYHLLYPLVAAVLLAVSAFGSANSVWFVSANTWNETVRFSATDYCGYNVSNLAIVNSLGCVYRGYQWQVPQEWFGFPIPQDISYSLSQVALTSVVAFVLVLVSLVHHAYTIRYSYRSNLKPHKDKLYGLAQIHFLSVSACFLFTLTAFVAQAAVIGHAVSLSGDLETGGVTLYWGQSSFLVLAAGVTHIGWGYEAVRWRAVLLA